jgi:hypothetical protein
VPRGLRGRLARRPLWLIARLAGRSLSARDAEPGALRREAA